MERTTILDGLKKFTERLTSQTYPETFREQGRSGLLKDGLGTRANSIWKMAEYVVAFIDDKETTPEQLYLDGWNTLCKNYKNQYLILEVTKKKWKMYDSYGTFLGDDTFIDNYLKQKAAAVVQSAPQTGAPTSPTTQAGYGKADFIKETFLTEQEAEEIKTILLKNKNIILYGAPGVGKTWTAKRIAYLMQGAVNNDTIESIQFHQSYSYDSFIEGYRPTESSFKLENGVFRDFCEKARDDEQHRDYFFIIDEINRGNISKIMGELLSLIEFGYRGEEHSMKLSYSHDDFYVPDNVYIIGMMNTADRSLSIIDYALRRRFAFIPMKPQFDSPGFIAYNAPVTNPKYKSVISAIKELNKTIVADPVLGEGFEIGHSYFCFGRDVTDKELDTIIKYQIIPMIKEYWFDNLAKAKEEAEKLIESIK